MRDSGFFFLEDGSSRFVTRGLWRHRCFQEAVMGWQSRLCFLLSHMARQIRCVSLFSDSCQCGFDEHVHGFKKQEDTIVGASCLGWSAAQLHAAVQFVCGPPQCQCAVAVSSICIWYPGPCVRFTCAALWTVVCPSFLPEALPISLSALCVCCDLCLCPQLSET